MTCCDARLWFTINNYNYCMLYCRDAISSLRSIKEEKEDDMAKMRLTRERLMHPLLLTECFKLQLKHGCDATPASAVNLGNVIRPRLTSLGKA
jgi:hypothetical protein